MKQYEVKIIIASKKNIVANSAEEAMSKVQSWLDQDIDLNIIPEKVEAISATLCKGNPKVTIVDESKQD